MTMPDPTPDPAVLSDARALADEWRNASDWYPNDALIERTIAHLDATQPASDAPANEAGEDVMALCKRVFLTAHWDGWTGNQLRRDVQNVDAEKSWQLYVAHGALAESITAAAPKVASEAGAGA